MMFVFKSFRLTQTYLSQVATCHLYLYMTLISFINFQSNYAVLSQPL